MNLLAAGNAQSTPQTLADAVRNAARFGHRPAITALTDEGRYEQSYTSLAQWAAKGAHLLQADLSCEPGDRLAVLSRVSWHTTAIVLAAWWVGLEVTTDPTGAQVVIVSEPPTTDVGDAHMFSVGGAIDGAPVTPFGVNPWTHEVRLFPDTPPPATCLPDMPAVRDGDVAFSHRDLINRTDVDGVIGRDVDAPITAAMLFDVAARPMLTGQRTVIIDRVAQASAHAERVSVWR